MLNIKELRKKVGISQTELARQLKIGQNTVAMWESGANNPRTDRLPELAKILKCSIDELFA